MDEHRVPESVWRTTVRALQSFLAVAALAGAVDGRSALVINGLVGLAFTVAPALLERRWGVTIDRSLVAWVAAAASLHVAGMVVGLYDQPSRYDDLTHAASGSAIAAAAYVLVAAWERSTYDLSVPPSFRFLVVVGVVVAGGVAWEVVEFSVSRGVQLGLYDTLTDLLYNVVGGLAAVALGGSALGRVAEALAADLADRARE